MVQKSNEALIAEARQRRTDHPTQTSDGPLIDRLTDALESAERDRALATKGVQHLIDALDTAYQRAEDTEREMHARELHHFEEEERSAALAAVVEKVREQEEEHSEDIPASNIESILTTAPADVLREHDAKVRAEALREPSDAEVEAAAEVFWEYDMVDDYRRERARAALLAAQEVRNRG